MGRALPCIVSEYSILALGYFPKGKILTVRNFTHSVMFHHFHGDQHPKRQGSISGDDFERMLDWLGDRYNLISSEDYADKMRRGVIQQQDICLSFDDALKCQWDIAVPILAKRNLKAFFFIYSSPFLGEPDLLEILSLFRSTRFNNIDDFYARFFDLVETEHSEIYQKAREGFDPKTYLSDWSFYSDNDRFFRFLRDQSLTKNLYEALNMKIMADDGFSISEAKNGLWMSDDHVRKLDAAGHSIGLHSYSHPTEMGRLNRASQEQEYRINADHLHDLLGGKSVKSMSHPCGNYDDRTLSVLRDMDVDIGFRSNTAVPDIISLLEIPREDHAIVMQEMNA